ncbi:hypothetical protein K1T71_011034 [Dendrolimus kikuchii]|uniref:Uncharacterized protein n=1 Tax=Dendrolimus kikuchii TaxID=765133 RepID=A0ACC1CMU5_9NEOP|nr:hypothetical protein K1T71_011034 [Dendrolimus kikuchii]
MFASEVLTTFGISAVLSFVLSLILLLAIAAKKGMLRVGARHGHRMNNAKLAAGPLLLTPSAPPMPKSVEMTPLAAHSA